MRIPETENCYGGEAYVRGGVKSPELVILIHEMRMALSLDQDQAVLLIPVLQHFVETGEMPCTIS
ncbi:hypothetical protein OTAKU_00490 [Serratia phage vB_SmaM-Otaku]|uniref:Uncharacterized protein n=1 Tax=Serratia phage vB_SmaM-Otaku TaxID=2932867 RepID=A0AAE9HE78_9CAUD|nr:hypothetical protein PF631_gp49 [Serratia phage vB_SmaM-Otaku]UPU16038.1 hypothetical protein OTAKU_00490 [Serratia phage vB_SmaM-Otaku]